MSYGINKYLKVVKDVWLNTHYIVSREISVFDFAVSIYDFDNKTQLNICHYCYDILMTKIQLISIFDGRLFYEFKTDNDNAPCY